MDGQDRTAIVMPPGQHKLELELLQLTADPIGISLYLCDQILLGLLIQQLQQLRCVFGSSLNVAPPGHVLTQRSEVLHDFLRPLRVIPKRRSGCRFLQLDDLPLLLWQSKLFLDTLNTSQQLV
jgi:hypothetical protein